MGAVAVAGFVVGAGSVALTWGLSGSDGTFTPVGQARISGGGVGSCSGAGGLGYVDKGTLVTVQDSADRVVATGSLGAGMLDNTACVFPIVVPGVPSGSDSYSVQLLLHGKTKITNKQARTGALVVNLG
ncbi:hypothetical protein [Streptacidiphilus melanogenes]|uniref:hypothetical protein n=1 Tax=Streptacidiphilus melanogenes TaxID=411235 RepID=UPI0006933618|nr:hypothetical protein [Streptacidiphilus melanogenes]